jgi:hypothetical protein
MIEPLLRTVDRVLVEPADGLPHLLSRLTNVISDKALNLVAKTFHGIVLYQMRTSGGRYDIPFFDEP